MVVPKKFRYSKKWDAYWSWPHYASWRRFIATTALPGWCACAVAGVLGWLGWLRYTSSEGTHIKCKTGPFYIAPWQRYWLFLWHVLHLPFCLVRFRLGNTDIFYSAARAGLVSPVKTFISTNRLRQCWTVKNNSFTCLYFIQYFFNSNIVIAE